MKISGLLTGPIQGSATHKKLSGGGQNQPCLRALAAQIHDVNESMRSSTLVLGTRFLLILGTSVRIRATVPIW